MNLNHCMNRYQQIAGHLLEKRKNAPYRRISGLFYGGSNFCVRWKDDMIGGPIEFTSWYAARNHKLDSKRWEKPPAIVTLYTDRFDVHPSNKTMYLLSGLFQFLTHGAYYIVKNRRVNTNATHLLTPATSLTTPKLDQETKLWRRVYVVPLTGFIGDYSDCVQHIKDNIPTVHVRNGFTYYDGKPPESHEQVLNRSWVPGKRSEYLRHLKKLRKHGHIRARLGGFNQLADRILRDWNHQNDWDNNHTRLKELQDGLGTADTENPQTYETLTEFGIRQYRRITSVDSETFSEAAFDTGLKKLREQIRTGTGAVVYS